METYAHFTDAYEVKKYQDDIKKGRQLGKLLCEFRIVQSCIDKQSHVVPLSPDSATDSNSDSDSNFEVLISKVRDLHGEKLSPETIVKLRKAHWEVNYGCRAGEYVYILTLPR